MQFHAAKVADILRCTQRDNEFVNNLQENVSLILKAFSGKNYNLYKKAVPYFTNFWYFYLTSASNLQTLGEEYAGILRIVGDHNRIPSKLIRIIWLSIYVGGEPLFDRLLQNMRKSVSASESLTENAKKHLTNWINIITENKHIFLRIHHSIFYVNGVFYNLSNRLTGIKYVLVRQWLQDDSATKSFKILGKLSLLYLILYLVQIYFAGSGNSPNLDEDVKPSGKFCVLCAESCKNTSATPCGHLFCWNCIYDSLKYNQKCPVCREHINPSRVVFLQNYE